MNNYLAALAAIVFIYFLGSFYFICQERKAAAVNKQNIQMAVEAMGEAIQSQQNTIDRLEKLVAKVTLEKECK